MKYTKLADRVMSIHRANQVRKENDTSGFHPCCCNSKAALYQAPLYSSAAANIDYSFLNGLPTLAILSFGFPACS
jgi:hypothetical protein